MKKFSFISFLHLPEFICCHLFGIDHSSKHRIICGLLIASVGMTLTYTLSGGIFRIIGDYIGLSLHAIGVTPIIEKMSTKKEEELLHEQELKTK